MPTLVLLAGPNGAGKTTFINRFLRQRAEAFRFVNPDEVARGLAGEGAARDLAAGRLVLERLDALFFERADVVLETTLATRSHAPRLRRFKAAGYRAELIYLRPPSADFSVARVARRVAPSEGFAFAELQNGAGTTFPRTRCVAALRSASTIWRRPTNRWWMRGRSMRVATMASNC
ncbi:AAA family ATPase [Brevundimonas sp. SORGH_AS_0993]|uniref:AAA family ATPase n=1 Tax=Brevundimonas sp. SORGH_AS_0993 TaxID=3041794 RepID=UPI0027826040|nr:AAA family ATPase [Brevundimonas sp. SORGH_AS_0993]MDQ1155224.1 putative ABC-type ATPase [Brevundimonas sp. SORGH_AS_0993]